MSLKRILLALENFDTRTLLESQLRKMGFDVLSIATTADVENELLTFSPDAVLSDLKKNRVDGLKVARLCKGKSCFVFLVFDDAYAAHPKDLVGTRVDGLLNSQFDIKDVVVLLAKRFNLDLEALGKKLNRNFVNEGVQVQVVRSSDSAVSDRSQTIEERVQRYSKILKKTPLPERDVIDGRLAKDFVEKSHPDTSFEARQREKADFMRALLAKVSESQ